MNKRVGILTIAVLTTALLGASCTATESDVDASRLEPITGVVYVPDPSDDAGIIEIAESQIRIAVRKCLTADSNHQAFMLWFASQDDINAPPESATYGDWVLTWIMSNPGFAQRACEEIGENPVYYSSVGERAKKAEEAARNEARSQAFSEVRSLVREALVDNPNAPAFADLADHGIADSTIVWCAANPDALVAAGTALGIGPDHSAELGTAVTVTSNLDWLNPVFDGVAATALTRDDREELWWNWHFDSVARSCEAAHDAR